MRIMMLALLGLVQVLVVLLQMRRMSCELVNALCFSWHCTLQGWEQLHSISSGFGRGMQAQTRVSVQQPPELSSKS
jgi:hypothetical protein